MLRVFASLIANFRAAVISGCCEDPGSVTYGAGLAFQDDIRAFGYPLPGPAAGAFWRPFSLARNARRMHKPLLTRRPIANFVPRSTLSAVSGMPTTPSRCSCFPTNII